MTTGGDAAEQVVRLSLEGFEVAVRLSGAAAKNIAFMLAAALKQEQTSKTKGKTRLTSLIKSGKELKVFSIQNGDLDIFTKQAKQYGVLYCALRDKHNKDECAVVDIIARAEDAAKIERICDRFSLGGKVQDVSIVTEVEKAVAERLAKSEDREVPTQSRADRVMEEIQGKPRQKEANTAENPTAALMEKGNLSRQNFGADIKKNIGRAKAADEKPSVRKELERCKEKVAEQKAAERKDRGKIKEPISANAKNNQTVHEQLRQNNKDKNKSKGR